MAYNKREHKITLDIEVVLDPNINLNDIRQDLTLKYIGASKATNIKKNFSSAEEYVESEVEKLNLDYRYNKVIAVGIMSEYLEEPLAFATDNEQEMMDWTASKLDEVCDMSEDVPVLSGFYISTFDIPILIKKFMKYRIKTKHKIFGSKPWDCRDINAVLDVGKLDSHLKYFGIQGKYKNLTGADVDRLYKAKDWDTITKYSKQDAQSEYELGELLFGLIK